MNNDQALRTASETSGIDFSALKSKYSSGSAFRRATPTTQSEIDDIKLQAAKESHARLDNLKICTKCEGLGYINERYNHQVKEINCPQCDGESILMKQVLQEEINKLELQTD